MSVTAYYRTSFPWAEFGLLLSVPGQPDLSPALGIENRELSFRKGWRYLSFNCTEGKQKSSLQSAFCSGLPPPRMDIGAFYTLPVRHHVLKLAEFQPRWTELRFDIDITDYNSVRLCTGKNICASCRPLLKCAALVLSRLLREQFSLRQQLWCFSGGRGLHCWVLDPAACFFTAAQRIEISEFLREAADSLQRPERLIWQRPLFRQLYREYMQPAFELMLANEQLSLRSGPFSVRLREFLGRLSGASGPGCRQWLESQPAGPPMADWALLRRQLGEQDSRAVVFGVMFPKIDHGVTRGINHMLRAPFSVREDNGNLVQPLDLAEFDDFDFSQPLQVKEHGTPRFRLLFEQALEVFRDTMLCRTEQAHQLSCRLCLDSRLKGAAGRGALLFSSHAEARQHAASEHGLQASTSSSSIASVLELSDQLSGHPTPLRVRRVHFERVLSALK